MQQTSFYYQILSGEITKKQKQKKTKQNKKKQTKKKKKKKKKKKNYSIQSCGPYMQHTFLTSCTILPSIINVSSMALKL